MKTDRLSGSEEVVGMCSSVWDMFVSRCLHPGPIFGYTVYKKPQYYPASNRSQSLCPCCLLEERGSSPLWLSVLVFSGKMAKASISLRALNEALNRSLRGCASTVLRDKGG